MERRHLLKTVGTAGAAVPLLAACGSDAAAGSRAGDGSEPEQEKQVPKARKESAGRAEKRLAAAGDIPIGGGRVFKKQKVVVTQPVKGDFRAFSAQCTHGGCLVTEVSGGTINCHCHESSFELSDGGVAGGPAKRPLSPAKVTLDGEDLVLEG